jgi:hypothetical protein
MGLMNDIADPHAHAVHEAVGADLSAEEAASTISLGVVSLLVAGVLPALLGSFADEHRLSASAIGLAATLEALTMGGTTAIAAMALPPRHLRTIGIVASLALALLNLAGLGAGQTMILASRLLAGVPEGVLLWITVGMIARSETPERWAGVFFTASTAAQLVLALAFAFIVIPRFGGDGGLITLALCTLSGVGASLWCPKAYAPLPGSHDGAGSPPLRGWFALAATFIFLAAPGAIGIYLQPLAHEAGLSADVARTALWVSLAAQIAGAATATALAGRVRYLEAFIVTSVVWAVAWTLFGLHVSASVFVLANTAAGFVYVFVSPFLVPMTIEADPSRRAAVQSAGAQLLAAAFGPFLSSQIVSDANVHGSLFLGGVLLAIGLSMIVALHVIAVRERIAQSA